MPALLSSKALYAFLILWTITWGFALAFIRKLSELSSLKELKYRHNHRLNIILPELRSRVLWLICVSAFSGAVQWVMASSEMVFQNSMYGLASGFLIGVSFSYLLVIPFWFDELHKFIERLKLEDNSAQRTESFLKEFGAKSSK